MIRALPVRVSRAHGDKQNDGQEGCYEDDQVGEEGHQAGDEDRQEGHEAGEEGDQCESAPGGPEGCPFDEVDFSTPRRSGEEVDWCNACRLPHVDETDIVQKATGTRPVD
jgi:hypothetical protein